MNKLLEEYTGLLKVIHPDYAKQVLQDEEDKKEKDREERRRKKELRAQQRREKGRKETRHHGDGDFYEQGYHQRSRRPGSGEGVYPSEGWQGNYAKDAERHPEGRREDRHSPAHSHAHSHGSREASFDSYPHKFPGSPHSHQPGPPSVGSVDVYKSPMSPHFKQHRSRMSSHSHSSSSSPALSPGKHSPGKHRQLQHSPEGMRFPTVNSDPYSPPKKPATTASNNSWKTAAPAVKATAMTYGQDYHDAYPREKDVEQDAWDRPNDSFPYEDKKLDPKNHSGVPQEFEDKNMSVVSYSDTADSAGPPHNGFAHAHVDTSLTSTMLSSVCDEVPSSEVPAMRQGIWGAEGRSDDWHERGLGHPPVSHHASPEQHQNLPHRPVHSHDRKWKDAKESDHRQPPTVTASSQAFSTGMMSIDSLYNQPIPVDVSVSSTGTEEQSHVATAGEPEDANDAFPNDSNVSYYSSASSAATTTAHAHTISPHTSDKVVSSPTHRELFMNKTAPASSTPFSDSLDDDEYVAEDVIHSSVEDHAFSHIKQSNQTHQPTANAAPIRGSDSRNISRQSSGSNEDPWKRNPQVSNDEVVEPIRQLDQSSIYLSDGGHARGRHDFVDPWGDSVSQTNASDVGSSYSVDPSTHHAQDPYYQGSTGSMSITVDSGDVQPFEMASFNSAASSHVGEIDTSMSMVFDPMADESQYSPRKQNSNRHSGRKPMSNGPLSTSYEEDFEEENGGYLLESIDQSYSMLSEAHTPLGAATNPAGGYQKNVDNAYFSPEGNSLSVSAMSTSMAVPNTVHRSGVKVNTDIDTQRAGGGQDMPPLTPLGVSPRANVLQYLKQQQQSNSAHSPHEESLSPVFSTMSKNSSSPNYLDNNDDGTGYGHTVSTTQEKGNALGETGMVLMETMQVDPQDISDGSLNISVSPSRAGSNLITIPEAGEPAAAALPPLSGIRWKDGRAPLELVEMGHALDIFISAVRIDMSTLFDYILPTPVSSPSKNNAGRPSISDEYVSK